MFHDSIIHHGGASARKIPARGFNTPHQVPSPHRIASQRQRHILSGCARIMNSVGTRMLSYHDPVSAPHGHFDGAVRWPCTLSIWPPLSPQLPARDFRKGIVSLYGWIRNRRAGQLSRHKPKTTDGLHAGAGTYSNGARLFGTHLPEDNLRILGHGQSSGQKGETDGVSYTNTLRIRTLQLMQMYSQYENHTLRNQRNHSLSPLVKVL